MSDNKSNLHSYVVDTHIYAVKHISCAHHIHLMTKFIVEHKMWFNRTYCLQNMSFENMSMSDKP